MSDVVRGIEFVAQAHKKRVADEAAIAKKKGKKAKRVLSAANMSLGGIPPLSISRRKITCA